MARKARRGRREKRVHVDRYAAQAAVAQSSTQQFLERSRRENPTRVEPMLDDDTDQAGDS